MANHGKDANHPSVTIYAAAATGNASPLAKLSGSHTGMQQIQYPAVDAAGDLYLSDSGTGATATSGTVSFFGATGLSGNQPFASQLAGLPSPEGIAIDSKGDVYVARDDGINVYAPHPTATTKPLRTLTGTLAHSNQPYGLAIDSKDRLYVAVSDEIEVFAAGASGNAAPIQEFDGSSDAQSGLDSCLSVAVDSSFNIYCANFNNSTITEYAAGANGTMVTPMVTAIDATKTSIDEPFGIFVDKSNLIYVSNYGNSSVAVFTSTSLATGKATRIITGAATSLNSPYGIYVR